MAAGTGTLDTIDTGTGEDVGEDSPKFKVVNFQALHEWCNNFPQGYIMDSLDKIPPRIPLTPTFKGDYSHARAAVAQAASDSQPFLISTDRYIGELDESLYLWTLHSNEAVEFVHRAIIKSLRKAGMVFDADAPLFDRFKPSLQSPMKIEKAMTLRVPSMQLVELVGEKSFKLHNRFVLHED